MIKNVLTDIGGIGLYGIVSVCLFFTVFTGALVWALLKKPAFLNYMGALPLADEPQPNPAREGDSRHE
jgi:hypothetical protein